MPRVRVFWLLCLGLVLMTRSTLAASYRKILFNGAMYGKRLSASVTRAKGEDEIKEDPIESAIGPWGRWQMITCLWLSLLKVPVAWHQLGIVFLAPPVDFWCSDKAAANSTTHKTCTYKSNGSEVPCASFEYDRSIFSETIVTEWDLVCGRQQLANVAQTVFMFGILLGNLIFGCVSDRWGRKMPLLAAVSIEVVAGTLVAFIPWFPAFLVGRFLLAISVGGTMITSFVLCMEIIGSNWRIIVATLFHIPFSLGHISLAGIAYLARDWHKLQLATSVPTCILLIYWCVIPESPRWLLATGKEGRAMKILCKAASVNKMSSPKFNKQQNVSKDTEQSVVNQATIVDLFRTPNMRKKTLCIYYNWFVCGMCFYGLAQYMGQIGGDIFINITISGLIEVPGALLTLFIIKKIGRRKSLLSGHLTISAACLLIMAVPSGNGAPEWPKVALAAIGRVGTSLSFTTVYLYSGELFPTVVRNVGVGSASMNARIGSMIAPFITSIVTYSVYLPPLVFGCVPLLGAILCLMLPETTNTDLPDTIEEGEKFGKERKKVGAENNAYLEDQRF